MRNNRLKECRSYITGSMASLGCTCPCLFLLCCLHTTEMVCSLLCIDIAVPRGTPHIYIYILTLTLCAVPTRHFINNLYHHSYHTSDSSNKNVGHSLIDACECSYSSSKVYRCCAGSALRKRIVIDQVVLQVANMYLELIQLDLWLSQHLLKHIFSVIVGTMTSLSHHIQYKYQT